MSTPIHRIATNTPALDDETLLDTYAFPDDRPWLRMNFIASLDGAATLDGASGGLGDDADQRVLNLLRRPADAVLVAAGTVRHEGYGAMRLDDQAVTWRRKRGLADHPVFAVVSRTLNLDPRSPIFAEAPVRPVILTVTEAPEERRRELDEVADVVSAGRDDVEPLQVRRLLHERGLRTVHGEGGPSLFGAFVAADAVDELCLTLSPTLTAGKASRIGHAERAVATRMRLSSALQAGDELLLRYTRTPETS